jgi:hypothetical protein
MERGPLELPETILWDDSPAPGVRLLTINRPERRNAIGAAEARGLTAALSEFRGDDSARVLVITGTGTEAFCAGADLHSVAAMYGEGDGSDTEPLFEVDPQHPASPTAGNIGPTRWTSTSRSSPRSTGPHTRAAWSGPALPTSASPTGTRHSGSPAGAGTSASVTAARSVYRG